ncbi:MAG TPA: GntR family transcriptional regulator [Rugosimonospora sp.]|nr:GntR family transcriptional regulator [Rugosimonospora sp.]
MSDVSASRNPLLTPLARSTTTSDLAVESIRSAILAGRLKPGDTLVERRLAEQLGVSKTPVREALIALAGAGLVTVSPNRGATVREVTARDVRHAYEVRLLLEPWAVARTVKEDRTAATAAHAALDEAKARLHGRDQVPMSLANRRFHRALYAGCGNPLVVGQLDAVADLATLGALTLIWQRSPSWEAEHAEHAEILAACSAGDAEAASRLLRTHIRTSLRRLPA